MTPTSGAPGLYLDGIRMAFDRRTVLDDVSLAFEPGLVHGLVGHNGSGKSTLIRIAAGYHRPTGGTIRLGDDVVPAGAPQVCFQRGLRFVHQELGLVPEFTALENLGLGTGYSRTWRRTVDWTAQRHRLDDALAMLDVDLPPDRPVSGFSAVQRALLAISRALAPAPDGSTARFLMLDEPTTALEGPEAERLFAVVRRLTGHGVGVLFVSHQLDELADLSDVITVLRDGRVVTTMRRAEQAYDQERIVVSMLGGEQLAAIRTPARREDDRPDAAPPVLAITGLRSDRLRGIDLSVSAGECVGVVGLAGSGREDLVYAVSGAARAEVTRLEIDGRARPQLRPRDCARHRIALVPGNRLPGSIVKDFSIQENLSFASLPNVSRPGGLLHARKDRRLAESWMDRFQILPAIPTYRCRQLSGGNKQKVILAKWLATEPTMLLLDEPTAGVDIGAAAKLLERVRQLVDQGMSVLMSTSEISDALTVADRIVVLARGQVVAEFVRGRDAWTEESVVHRMTGVRPASAPLTGATPDPAPSPRVKAS